MYIYILYYIIYIYLYVCIYIYYLYLYHVFLHAFYWLTFLAKSQGTRGGSPCWLLRFWQSLPVVRPQNTTSIFVYKG
jgi:hypothetical protein